MTVGDSHPVRRSAAGAALTAREQELAELAASGSSSAEIAEQLGLSIRTVEHHLSSVYSKLGLRSRAELAARFRAARGVSRPETRYARSKHGHIAYQVCGEGSRDVVLVPGFVSNVETGWEWPALAAFLERLGTGRRLIIFDKRGTGLSDPVRDPEALTLEDRMDDITAVLDAARSERATVIGFSEGAALALLFAGVHPERSNGLVLFGALASAHLSRDSVPAAMSEEAKQRFLSAWGSGKILAMACPSISGTAEGLQDLSRFERHGASPGAAYDLYAAGAAVEARNLGAAVQVPTLILHRVDDGFASVENSRFLAGSLPRNDYVELAGADHPPWLGDVDLAFTHLERFLAQDHRAGKESRSILTTVVRFGPADVAAVAPLVQQHQGRACQTPHGLAYLFDSPARAVAFASGLIRQRPSARAAVHSGEVAPGPDGATGPVVDQVQVVLEAADAGEVWMSQTTAALVGSQVATLGRSTVAVEGSEPLTAVQVSIP